MSIDTTEHLRAAIEGVSAEAAAAPRDSRKQELLDLVASLLVQARYLREHAMRGMEPARAEHCPSCCEPKFHGRCSNDKCIACYGEQS